MTNNSELHNRAETLVEALKWIRKFRDQTIVVRVDHQVLEHQAELDQALLDILFLQTVGFRPVVVHGAGNRLQSLSCIEDKSRVMVDEINRELAEGFEAIGGRAMTLSHQSTPVLTGRINDAEGQLGTISEVDRLVIDNLCYAGQVPFIPSLCEDEAGEKLTLDADETATRIACELSAQKLVFLGVGSDEFERGVELGSLNRDTVQKMLDGPTSQDELVGKFFRNCLEALDKGVGAVHLLAGQSKHPLLLEIYTHDGVGTMID